MPQYQVSEIVNLIVGVALTPVLYRSVRDVRARGARWFVPAYAFFFVSYLTTVLEGFFWPVAFNLVEHIGYAAAGILMLFGAIELRGGILRANDTHR